MARLALLAAAVMAATLLTVRPAAADNAEHAATVLGLSTLANDFLACAGLRDHLAEAMAGNPAALSLHEGANGAAVTAGWLLALSGMAPAEVPTTIDARRASWANEFAVRVAAGDTQTLADRTTRCQAIQPLQSAMVMANRAMLDSGQAGAEAYLPLFGKALDEDPSARAVLRQAIDR